MCHFVLLKVLSQVVARTCKFGKSIPGERSSQCINKRTICCAFQFSDQYLTCLPCCYVDSKALLR